MNREIYFSHLEDDWLKSTNSIELAAEHYLLNLSDDERKSAKEITLYQGEKVPSTFGQYFSVSSLIDDMANSAFDCAGDSAEDYLGDVTKEQEDELEKLVEAWAEKHGIKPTWGEIVNVKEITYKVNNE